MMREQRKRLAAIRAIAPLATKERQPDEDDAHARHLPVEGDDESPPDDPPQVNRASHYS
jgi:hypothetical protein